MLEIIIIGCVILVIVSEFNPVLAVRKIWAALSFGVGATPKSIETCKAKSKQWLAEAKEAEAREGKIYDRIGSSFKHKGGLWADETFNPVIQDAQTKEEKAKESLAYLTKSLDAYNKGELK